MVDKKFQPFDPFMPIKSKQFLSEKSTENEISTDTESKFDFFGSAAEIDTRARIKSPYIKQGMVILLTSLSIGDDNDIGRKLMKDFLYSFSEAFCLPQYLIFMNNAVKMIGENESLIKKMNKYGVKALVSNESAKFFNIKLGSFMIQAETGDITEKICFAKQLIKL